MHVITHAAELAGGLGAILVGTSLATSGLGIALGRRLGGGDSGTSRSGLSAFARGLVTAGLLGANGSLPAGAASLARRAGATVERTTMLVIGSSFGAASMAVLAVLVGLGWGVYTSALVVLALTALAHTLRSRWTPWGEAGAGLSLVIVGLSLLAKGWSGIGPWLSLPTVDQKPLLIPGYIVLGTLLGAGLRSPGAAAAFFVQGAVSMALDGLSAAVGLLGVLASLCWCSLANLRTGTAEERGIAAVHGIFALLATLIGALVFVWGYRLPSMLLKMPGGPALWLALQLLVALGGATAMLAFVQRPLHWLLAGRLAPRLARSILARDLGAGCASIPALALGGLGGACDAAAGAARDLARKELSGAGTTELRRRQSRDAATCVVDEIDAFRAGLEGVRWPGEAVEAVLQASRAARLWRELIDLLAELPALSMPSGDEALKKRFVRLRFGALYRIEGVDEEGGTVTAQHLAEERDVFEAELAGLRTELVQACAGGSVDASRLAELNRHLDLLSALVRTALAAVESRELVESVPFRFVPELPEEAEPLLETEAQAEQLEEETAPQEEGSDTAPDSLVDADSGNPRFVRIGALRRTVPAGGGNRPGG